MKILSVLAAAAILLSMAGCGSSGPSYGDAASVAKAAGLKGCKADGEAELFVADAQLCGSTEVNWFKDKGSVANWNKAASAMGGGLDLVGSNWAIECNSKAQCDRLKAAIGGSIS